MRAAPAVSVRCTGGPVWRTTQAALAACAAAAVGTWCVLWFEAAPGWAIVVASMAALAAGAGWRAAAVVPATLAWDGRRWAVDDRVVALDVMVDLGRWMLLRLRPGAGRALWVDVSARGIGAAWHGLRVAAHAGGVSAARTVDAGDAAAPRLVD